MNLFTSNSSQLPAKSMWVALVLFIIYSVAVHVSYPDTIVFQNQRIKNYAISQDYLYSNRQYATVIVGSSLAARLHKRVFEDDRYILTVEGGSALTAIELIIKSQKYPQQLLIETNIIEEPATMDADMADRLFVPLVSKIKRTVKSLQYRNQPVNLALSQLSRHYGRTDQENMDYKYDSEILRQRLPIHISSNAHIDMLTNSESIARLVTLVDILKKHGVNVGFFRMPVHPKVADSRRYRERRKLLNKEYANTDVTILSDPLDQSYETTDGIHLTYRSAREFSIRLNMLIDGTKK